MNPAIVRLRSKRLLRLATVLATGGMLVPASAVTWDGLGGDSNWGTPGNWGGTAPTATGDTLVFAGSTQLTNVNNVVTSTAGITYNAGAGAFVSTSTVGTLTLAGNVTNNSANTQTLNMATAITGNARTVTVADAAGVMVFGSTAGTYAHTINTATGTTNRTVFTGLGEVRYLSTTGSLQIGSTAATEVLMTGLAKFTANVGTLGFNSGTAAATTTTANLAPTTSITAGAFNLGTTSATSNGAVTTVNLGKTTTIAVDTITLVTRKGTATLGMQTGLVAPTITITGRSGGASTTDITAGIQGVGNTATGSTGTIDFTGVTLTAQLGNVILGSTGSATHTGSGGTARGNMTIDGSASVVSINTLRLGRVFATDSSLTSTARGDFTLKNGAVTVGSVIAGDKSGGTYGGGGTTWSSIGNIDVSGGSLTVNTLFRMGDNTAARTGTPVATLTITGGTVTSNVAMTTVDATATVILNGGTLDMKGNAIGTAVQQIGTLSFRSGTLQNVGTINGTGGLTKTTAGTLTLLGTMAYTGATNVDAGTLLVNSNSTLATGLTSVNNTAILGGNGTIGSSVTVGSTAFLGASDNTGTTLAILGGLEMNGTMNVELGGASMTDLYNVSGLLAVGTNATVDFSLLSALTGNAYVFAKYGTWNGQQFASSDAPAGWTINYAFNDGTSSNNFALVVIPEPGAVALGLLGGALLFIRRKRTA